MEYGYESELRDNSIHLDKPGGGMETIEFEARRYLRLNMQGVSNAERHVIRNIFDRAKKGGDLMITIDPNDTNSKNYDGTSIYRRLSNNTFIARSYNYNDLAIALGEN